MKGEFGKEGKADARSVTKVCYMRDVSMHANELTARSVTLSSPRPSGRHVTSNHPSLVHATTENGIGSFT
jgi:hypothetical protein